VRSVLALLVSVLLAFGTAIPTTAGGGAGGVLSTGTAKNAAAASSTTSADPDSAAVVSAVGQAVQNAADVGVTEQVVVLDRSTGALITSTGSADAVPAMSLVKLVLALDVINVAGGVGNVDASTLAELKAMITTSDDVIASDLYAAYGGSASIDRVIADYGLTGSSPSPEEEYWGDVQITASDVASLLYQALSAADTGSWLATAMAAATDTAADGFDQDFGVNALDGAGSKQGWGCCLGGVVALHSVGFTATSIVVVLSTSYPDQDSSDLQSAAQLAADPGAQTAISQVTATARAAALGTVG
jgi:hypothetical protein